MRLDKNIKPLTRVGLLLLFFSSILALFNIGPCTEPIYTYLSSSDSRNFIGILLLVISFLLSVNLIFSIITSRHKYYYSSGINIFLIFLSMDLMLGGNVLFMATTLINIIIFTFNLNILKRKKDLDLS